MYFATMMTLLGYFCLVVCFVASRIEGRGTWNVLENYEYYASNLGVFGSYDDGMGFCQDNDGELALVKTPDIQSFLEQLVTDEGSFPYAFFIGLQDISGTFEWNDGESLSYSNWQENEPSLAIDATCVVAGVSSTYNAKLGWDDIACGTGAKGFFCQRLIGNNWSEWGDWSNCVCPGQQQRTRSCTDTGRAGPDSCASGEFATENTTCYSVECNVTTPALTTTERPLGRGDWFPHGNFEYYVSAKSDGVSYTESQEYCNEEDGELALVKSSDVQSFIASLVPSDSGLPLGFYIGLRYDVASGEFLWSDGTPLEYKNWKPGEPNRDVYGGEDCAAMGHKYTYESGLPWHDYQCVSDGGHGKKGLVCQRRIGTYWSQWGVWTECSCATTNHSRNRICVDSTRAGPDDCIGADNETQQCVYEPSCHTTTVAETTTAYPTTTVKETTTKLEETTSVTTIATEKPTTVESEATTTVVEETTTIALLDTTTAGEETTAAAALETPAITEETTAVLAQTTTIAEETTMAATVETTTTAKEPTTSLAETTTAAEVTAEPVVVANTAMTEDNTTSTGQAPTTMAKETSTVLAGTTSFAGVTTAAAAVETMTVAGVTTAAAAVETTTVTEVTTAAAAVETTTMTEETTTITEKIETTPAGAGETAAATVGKTSGSGDVIVNTDPLATTKLQETLTSTEIVNKVETTTPQTPETTPAPSTARSEVTKSTTNGASGMETTTTKTPASSTASYTTANTPISTTNSDLPEVVTTAEIPSNATEEAGVPISAATSPHLSTTKTDGQVHTSAPESPATTKIVGVSPTAAPQNSIVGPIVGAIGGCLLLAIIFVIIIFKKHQTNRTGRMKVSTAPQLEMGRRGSDRQSLTHDNRHGVVMNWGDGIDGIWYGQEGVGNSTFAYQEEANNAKFGDETEPFRADDEPGPSEVTYAVINKNSSTMDSKQEDEDAENSISRHIEVNGDPYAVVDRTKKDTQPSESIENNDDTDAGQSEVTYAVVNMDRSAVDSKQEEQDHIEVNGDPYAVVDRTKKDIKPSESVDHIDANGDTYAVVNKSASTSPELQGKDDADPYSVI